MTLHLLKLYSMKALSFIETLTTLGNLGLGVTGEIHIRTRLPDGQQVHLYRYEIEDSAPRIATLVASVEPTVRVKPQQKIKLGINPTGLRFFRADNEMAV